MEQRKRLEEKTRRTYVEGLKNIRTGESPSILTDRRRNRPTGSRYLRCMRTGAFIWEIIFWKMRRRGMDAS